MQHNALLKAKAEVKRANAPLCRYCGVLRVKWCHSRTCWRTYCDTQCASRAKIENWTPEKRAANEARLYSYVQARRAKNPLVHAKLAQALGERTSLTSDEALEFGLQVYHIAHETGYHSGWKRRKHNDSHELEHASAQEI